MSTFFFPGRTIDAITGSPIDHRSDAALLPVLVGSFADRLADPAGRWVSRQSWQTWADRTAFLVAAREALDAVPVPPGLAVDRWVEDVRVRYQPHADLWILQDVGHLVSFDASDAEVGTFRDALQPARSGNVTLGPLVVRIDVAGDHAQVTARHGDRDIEHLVVPLARLATWHAALAPP